MANNEYLAYLGLCFQIFMLSLKRKVNVTLKILHYEFLNLLSNVVSSYTVGQSFH